MSRFFKLSLLDINDSTSSFNEAVRETTANVLGYQRKIKRSRVTNGIMDLCDKREQKKSKYSSPEGAAQYSTINKLMRSKMKGFS